MLVATILKYTPAIWIRKRGIANISAKYWKFTERRGI